LGIRNLKAGQPAFFMEKNQIQFGFEASYYKVGTIKPATTTIWMIFHGYGQLAGEFQERFSCIDTDKNVMIFPQGLSKFYLKGIDNKTGASWMTSHDREQDIKNYISYLRAIYTSEILPWKNQLAFNVLGFSQGAHTASRWIYREDIVYAKLILWGAGLAHEINAQIAASHFSRGGILQVIGDQDRYINEDALEKLKHRYDQIGLNYDLMRYHGGHDIFPEVLEKLI
jgi:predicted esterase